MKTRRQYNRFRNHPQRSFKSSSVQEYVDSGVDWTIDNRFQLNINKGKEIRISFSKNNADLPPLFINGQELEVVQNARLRGVTITNNISWNLHNNETIKKAPKQLYFLRKLKFAWPATSDLDDKEHKLHYSLSPRHTP